MHVVKSNIDHIIFISRCDGCRCYALLLVLLPWVLLGIDCCLNDKNWINNFRSSFSTTVASAAAYISTSDYDRCLSLFILIPCFVFDFFLKIWKKKKVEWMMKRYSENLAQKSISTHCETEVKWQKRVAKVYKWKAKQRRGVELIFERVFID